MDNKYRFVLWLVCLLAFGLSTVGRAAPPLQEATPTLTPSITPSPSETLAGTPLVTGSPTLVGLTPTAGSPTVTGPTPPTLTPLPGFTTTPTITLTPTPTETLEPLPEITLLFPVFTPTSTTTPTPEPAVLEATQAAEADAQRQPLPAEVLWVGFVILLLWLLLGAFLVAFLRFFGR